MSDDLLSATEAARRLGIAVTTLYAWLSLSDFSSLQIRGVPTTIDYLQGGPGGQGRIRIEGSEIERLRELMRVRPRSSVTRRPPQKRDQYPGIVVPLGRPDR